MATVNPNQGSRQSQVAEQLTNCQSTIQQLTRLITEIQERLQPILRDPEPMSENPKNSVSQILCKHANDLRDIAQSIKDAEAHLTHIFERIEL